MKLVITRRRQIIAGIINIIVSQMMSFYGKTTVNAYEWDIAAMMFIGLVSIIVIRLREDEKNRMPLYLGITLSALFLVAVL